MGPALRWDLLAVTVQPASPAAPIRLQLPLRLVQERRQPDHGLPTGHLPQISRREVRMQPLRPGWVGPSSFLRRLGWKLRWREHHEPGLRRWQQVQRLPCEGQEQRFPDEAKVCGGGSERDQSLERLAGGIKVGPQLGPGEWRQQRVWLHGAWLQCQSQCQAFVLIDAIACISTIKLVIRSGR